MDYVFIDTNIIKKEQYFKPGISPLQRKVLTH